MSRCISFPPPGYLWKGVSGQALIKLIKENAKEEREKEKMRRKKEKKKRSRENVEIKQKRKNHHKRRTCILCPNHGHHDRVNCATSAASASLLGSKCACWVCSLNEDIGVLLPCLFRLRTSLDQVLSSKEVCSITRQTNVAAQEKLNKPSRPSSVQEKLDSQYRELVLDWVSPPLETPISESNDLQWLYDKRPLRDGTVQKIVWPIHIQRYFRNDQSEKLNPFC